MALEFIQDDSTGGTVIFLCADCRAKLAIELAKCEEETKVEEK